MVKPLTRKEALANLKKKHGDRITLVGPYAKVVAHHTFRCSYGHRFKAVWQDVLRSDTPCRLCRPASQSRRPRYTPKLTKAALTPEQLLAKISVGTLSFLGDRFNYRWNHQTVQCCHCQHIQIISWKAFQKTPSPCSNCLSRFPQEVA